MLNKISLSIAILMLTICSITYGQQITSVTSENCGAMVKWSGNFHPRLDVTYEVESNKGHRVYKNRHIRNNRFNNLPGGNICFRVRAHVTVEGDIPPHRGPQDDFSTPWSAWKCATISCGQVDLTLIEPDDVSPNSVIAGNNVKINATIKNIGNARSGASSVGFYISNNSTFGGDIRIGSDNVPPINPNQSKTCVGVNAGIPAHLPTGYYYIFGKADDNNQISETNENNNVKFIERIYVTCKFNLGPITKITTPRHCFSPGTNIFKINASGCTGSTTYKWYVNNVLKATTPSNQVSLVLPSPTRVVIKVTAARNGITKTTSRTFNRCSIDPCDERPNLPMCDCRNRPCPRPEGPGTPIEPEVNFYPIPAFNSGQFNFRLQEASKVTLKLYNLQGQVVATYLDEKREIGFHNLEVDLSNLTKGTYFYVLQSQNFIIKEKLIKQ